MNRYLPLRLILIVLLLAAATGCQLESEPTATIVTATAEPTFTLAPVATPTPSVPPFLVGPAPGRIRIMCYNVNWDSMFPDDDPQNDGYRIADLSAEFVRMVRAINPDIVCLQEINSLRDPQNVADILDAALPLPDGARWQAHKGYDNVIASRWPILMRADQRIHEQRSVQRGHAMGLIDLPDADYDKDLYLINAHMKSAGGDINIALRQHHADALVQWVGDLKTTGGKADLPAGTPFMIMGDLNVYDTDPAYHLTTLITGDIVNTDKFGPPLKPDWDNTDLTDALPTHNAQGSEIYTWRDDSERFAPGPLDHIIYSDSSLSVEHSFVLNTTIMSDAELRAAGLEKGDVMLRPEAGDFDHLPLVVDVALR
jgi:endonuclease/exonuclease/phosphatase family metal-dependent hydrolase